MRKTATRFFALAMTLCMLVGILPMQLIAADVATLAQTSSETTYVLAGSDFQAKNTSTSSNDGNSLSQTIVSNILTQVKKDYPTMDGFLFAGDYDYDMWGSATSGITSETQSGKNALMDTVQGVYGRLMHEVYVQGNHDADNTAGTVLSDSGNNDPEGGEYGVFVINEKDYPWSTQSSEESTVKATAEKLKTYLDAKVEKGFTKPVFVMSHLPLHYSMRTRRDSDGMYANYIFDVLNAAGESGLNIIFLFGHNHSHGWDDYLGGAAIFLTKGDKINIAQSSQTTFKAETLNFTYMNAGYTGYYGETGSGVDSTLTMTTFAITGDEVEISRYDADGKHVLKAEGAYGCGYGLSSSSSKAARANTDQYDSRYDEKLNNYYSADTTTVNSPKSVELDLSLAANTDGNTNGTTSSVELKMNEWVEITKNVDASTKYVYTAATSITSDGSYVIVAGDANAALENNNGSFARVEDGITISGNTLTSDTELDKWIFSGSISSGSSSSSTSSTIKNGSYYINYGNNAFSLKTSSTTLTISRISTNSNQYSISYKSNGYGGNYPGGFGGNSSTNYFYYNGSTWTCQQNTPKYVRLYKHSNTETTPATQGFYVIAQGETVYNVDRGTTAEAALAAVKAGVKVYSCETKNEDSDAWEPISNDATNITWELDSSYNGSVAGEYAVNIKYTKDNVTMTVATVKVVVPTANVSGVSLVNLEGTVQKGAANDANTGAKLHVEYDDGTSADVAITVDMLSDAEGNIPSTATVDDIAGLSVSYRGKTASGSFTLHVVAKVGNNYPEYPDEGAVKVNKTGVGQQFNSTGVAKIELSTSGIPSKKGADVIVMLDLSSSMYDKDNKVNNKIRAEILKESIDDMIEQFKTPLEDGSSPDIRVAIADFYNYYGQTNSPYYLDTNDTLKDGQNRKGSTSATNKIYTGNGELDAGAFIDAGLVTSSLYSDITTQNGKSGTNYDYAFDAIYQLGAAITEKNEADGVSRDLFVVFMSDGAPFQYNYFSGYSEDEEWNNWLTGTVTSDMFKTTGAHNDYYNEDGKHWMAEAVKGDTDKTYPVIRKNDSRDTDGDNWIELAGLGAKMYSIGFALAKDNTITVDTMDTVIRNIASSNEYYFRANSADELGNAFGAISSDILYAATNARFVDTMGEAFDLQMSTVTKGASDSAITPIKPEIKVTSYDIYTKDDVNDTTVTEAMIGTRKGTYTVLETVTFSDDGTKAYSDKIDGGQTNILVDGVIRARSFYYNTTAAAVTVEGISIPTSVSNGITKGSTNSLPAETFYWNVGTVQSSELALSYYVYLTGSMEGTRDSGTYPTNSSAILYYDNYLENPCLKETVSPQMPWGEANVRYAFYLVDANGNVIVNRTSGETGSFANKIAVTNPIVAQTFHLNDNGVADADILASGVLPEGYTLYDNSAKYAVHVSSGSDGSSWTITKGTNVATTYVTGYNGSEFSKELSQNNQTYEYTHTTVWFAVVWSVGALNDTVVVDYGLPVDINVLGNDMFGDHGTLNALGATAPAEKYLTTANSTFASQIKTVNGTAYTRTDGTVRYQLGSTDCPHSDSFAYEVKYAGETTQFYYGTVTVIPATSVYFEESFVNYNDTTYSGSESENGKWTQEGTVDSDTTQAEDRPGKFSLNDANNIYGYDDAYKNMTSYSLGGAKKVTVDALTGAKTTAPSANFTFTGTGFDIISLTNSDSGLITVKVYKVNDDGTKGSYEKGLSVCNYYGYTYDATNGWVANPESTDCIWQVPVIKIDSLSYGKHYVEIKVLYADAFNLTGDDCYSFWLDAVRIYNPVDTADDTAAKDAYTADGEISPSYMTLRDLLVTAGDLGTKLTSSVNGAVFIDGKASTGSISDYANPGPNNETYLAYGQGVAFKLHSAVKPAAVHIGVKLAKGTSSAVRYTVANNAGNTATDLTKPVDTATDMYYDLGQYITWYEDGKGGYTSGTITLSNAENNTAVISVTNIKYTGATPTAQSLTALVDDDVVTYGLATMAMYAPAVEPEPFVPETFEADWTVGRAGKTSLLTVKTSTDVARLTVNGEDMKSVKLPVVTFNGGKFEINYVKAWIYTVKLEVGEHVFDIVAYDENSLASESFESTVNVTKKNGFFGK